jgi:hypothetical protein
MAENMMTTTARNMMTTASNLMTTTIFVKVDWTSCKQKSKDLQQSCLLAKGFLHLVITRRSCCYRCDAAMCLPDLGQTRVAHFQSVRA